MAYRWALAAAYGFSAAIVLLISLLDPGINNYHRARFADMVYGRAHSPYVQRVLVPTVVRTATRLTPESIRRWNTDQLAETTFVTRALKRFRWEREYLTEYLWCAAILFGCLVGFAVAIRALARALLTAEPRFFDLVGLVALWCLPVFFKYQSYIYDFAVLFLFTSALVLMARKQWKAYLAAFALTCLNKETGVLLAAVFVPVFWEQLWAERHLRHLLAAQVGIAVLIKAGLMLVFRDSPGGLIETHLAYNTANLTAYPVSMVVAWGAVAFLVLYDWTNKPRFLRRGVWIVVPLFVATIVFGIHGELRDLYEAYPLVLLLASCSWGKALGLRPATVREPGDAI